MFIRILVKAGLLCAGRAQMTGLVIGLQLVGVAAAQSERPVDRIQDNSFLVEEAYNQETGIVQHIGTGFFQHQRRPGADEERLELAFSQEWPVYGQKHQLSYTIPAVFTWRHGAEESGLGDAMVHYRWQAWFDPDTLTALAPRASVILPTGNAARGLGEDTVGAQFNLPFSTTLNPRWFVHANAGTTLLPDAASANGRALHHAHLGGSAIYALTHDLHLMLEWVGSWIESERAGGGTRHEWVSLISPGLRKAFDFRGDVQLVLGVAAPLGLTRASPDFGVFLYASLEHPFRSIR